MRRFALLSVAVGCSIAAGGGVAFATTSDDSKHVPGFAQQPLGGESPVELDAVPSWIRHTAAVALPAATFETAQLDQDEIGAVYEIKGTLKGRPAEVDVYPDGSLEEIEIVIDEEDVPGAPSELFASYFPNFTLIKVEKSIRPTKTKLLEVWYEWDGTTEDGTAVDVEVNSRGSTYLVEPD